MFKNIKFLQSFFLVIIIVLLSMHSGGIYILKKYNYFFRAIPVSDMASFEYIFPYKTPSNIQVLCGSSYQETLKNVMNFASCKHEWIVPISDHVKDFFECAQKGGRLTCNGMAELYLHALRLQGIKARKLFVVKNFGDPYDSHTIVEIFIDGKWRIFDPTFHVSFKKDGELLGAQDIAQSLTDGSFLKIEPIFYGEVNCPYRLDSYYMHWLSLYNNVLFFKYGQYSSNSIVRSVMQLLFHYWSGPKLYYFSQSNRSNSYFELLNVFYFLIVCIFPWMIVLIVFLLLLTILIGVYQKKNIYFKKGEYASKKFKSGNF